MHVPTNRSTFHRLWNTNSDCPVNTKEMPIRELIAHIATWAMRLIHIVYINHNHHLPVLFDDLVLVEEVCNLPRCSCVPSQQEHPRGIPEWEHGVRVWYRRVAIVSQSSIA